MVSLDLSVTLWVCHRSVADFYAEVFAPILEFRPYELSAIVRDNPVRNAESDHNVMEEFLRFGSCDRGDRLGLNPLGEFVDGDEEVCVTTRRFLQGADHVETPNCERPGDWDSLHLLHRHVYLPSKVLTSLTFADELISVCDCGWPEET